MEKAENFIDSQTILYEIYQKIVELVNKNDIKRYNSLMERIKNLLDKQDGYFYNINLKTEYKAIQDAMMELYKGHISKLMNSADRSQEEMESGIYLTAMAKRINNLRNYHTRGYRDQYDYSFENKLNKRAIKILNLAIKNTTDEEERKNLIKIFYDILYISPALETEYLIDPEAFVKEINESSINNNKIREYLDLENEEIKFKIIDMLKTILYLNKSSDYYATYFTMFYAIYIKAYLSFLSRSDIREIKENLKIIIETYPIKLSQEVINYSLDIVSSALKSTRNGKVLPFSQI